MKFKQLLTKTLLAAVCLLVGQSAWAYDVPEGYAIKNVIIGTLNSEGTAVDVEDFSSGTYNSSIFGVGTLYHSTSSERIGIYNYPTVAKPEVGASVEFDGETPIVPSYVDGNCLQLHHRSNSVGYNTIEFDDISEGILVFSYDFNFGGDNKNNSPYLSFVDPDGNNILQLGFKCGSGTTEYFTYKVGSESQTNDGSVSSSKLRNKYTGFGLKDIAINLNTGDVVYTLDCIGTDGKRYVTTTTKNINIGTGKTVSQIRFTQTGASSTSLKWWLDNISLYTVGLDVSHNYTVKATANNGALELKTIEESTCKEGLNYSITGLPYIIEKDGKFYVLDDAQVSNYGVTFAMGNADQVKEINYTLDESIVYYIEGEDLSTSTLADGYSGGAYGHVNAGTNSGVKGFSIGDFETGVYQASVFIQQRPDRGFFIRNSANANTENTIVNITSGTGVQTTSAFLLSGNTNLCISGYTTDNGRVNQSAEFDYVILRKLYDVTDASKVVGAVDYSTGYLDEMSNKVTLAPGESYNYKFINYNSGSSSQWLNYLVPVYTSEDVKTLVIRADNWEDMKETNAGCTSNFVWGDANATFITEMNGATVDMTINYSASNVLTMNAAIKTKSGYDWTYSYRTDYSESGISLTGDIKVALSVSNSWLELVYEGTTGTVSKAISNAGWATYCSPYPLDLANATNLDDAYIVTGGTGGVLAKTSVKNGTVPANTGLLLKGAQGTATIPVVASSSTDVSANKLVGVTAETQIDANTGYVLLKEDNVLRFYKNNNAFTLGANTAYLPVSFDLNGAARASYLLFDDMTGISQVAGSKVKTNSVIYNLNGQRVSNPTKGIYIIDGVKVAIE